MPAIHQLDPDLVNKIAAGEVIERPASVVKELVENAIDAGADRIEIALELGGTRLIRVTDNGCGIAGDDLPLAVASHATSKILTADDLFAIASLGFRGEALASIAAVSHLTIRSRPADQLEAHQLETTSGERPVIKPCAAPPGTTVEIRNLFYNVPARRKFLRQPTTEVANCTEQLARLALAHPQLGFTFLHNDRESRKLPVTADRRTRIADFYGSELADCLLSIRRNERGTDLEAFLAPPAESRASGKWQYFFLNGRFICDRRLAFAVREAFRGLVEPSRYPVVFLFLRLAPDEFDVNVHPTKVEVRWRDPGLIQSQVLSALRETLLSHDLTPSYRPPLAGSRDSSGGGRYGDSSSLLAASRDPNERYGAGVRHALADYLKTIDPTQARLHFAPPPFPSDKVRPSIAGDYVSRFPPPPPPPTPGATAGRMPDDSVSDGSMSDVGYRMPDGSMSDVGCRMSDVKESSEQSAMNEGPDGGEPKAAPSSPALSPQLTAYGSASTSAIPHPTFDIPSAIQIHNMYLVAQTHEGIIIVDQHALHERILYERFRDRLLAGPLESQRLLIPVAVQVSPDQAQAAEQCADLLARLGIELSPFGPTSLAVQSFPILLTNVEIDSFVRDMLDKLSEPGATPSEETLVHNALDMMACKAAIKAGDQLTSEEIQALLAQRHLVDRSSNCPHGRPTTLQLSRQDLERQFKRT